MSKIQCPYCPLDSDCDFHDTDEMNVHILREHPEKTSLEENKADRKSRIWSTAFGLTQLSYQAIPPTSKEEVLERFRWYMMQLMGMAL